MQRQRHDEVPLARRAFGGGRLVKRARCALRSFLPQSDAIVSSYASLPLS